MRCAIYARRSTEEHQAASLDVQVSEASRFIAAKGWTLAPEHVYRDDAVSRAEFKRRPGLIALLNAATSSAFDAVVIRDESRLGGDMHRMGLVLQDLIEHGVRVLYYFDDEEVRLDGATDKMLIAVRGFASELEREKIAGRTREHLETKARKGFNVGGRCYGYDNVPVFEGERRVRVDYKINDAEAAIVRHIFERYAAGEGYRTIAKDLNRRGVAAPQAGRRGTGSWGSGVVREILLRERYVGTLVWGKISKAYRGGTRVRVENADDDCVRVERPDLQIVTRDAWDAVGNRMSGRAGRSWKAGTVGPMPRYLLSGIARCAECGGPMTVSNTKRGTARVKVYGCMHHRDRSEAVCGNTLRRPVDAVDAAVIEWIQANVLQEELVADALKEVRRRLAERAERPNTELADLEAEARRLRSELDRLVNALASGVESPTIAKVIDEKEKRLTEVGARLAVLRAAPSVLDLEVRRLEKEARKRLGDLRGLLGRNPTDARRALEAIFAGPLTLQAIDTDDGRRYRIEGSAAFGTLFTTDGDPTGNRTRVTGVRGRCPNR
jgi:site-specific DNA recombinase